MLLAGILTPLYEAIAWLLAAFYSVVPSLGVSIILLTFTIMLLLYPLTAKQARSMIAMQQVQPEIKRIQAKYKNDRQKLNEEMMKFYQENKINPLAGCLPLLAQMPIFFALFAVLNGIHKYVPRSSSLFQDLCVGFGNRCGVDATAADARRFPGIEVGEKVIHHLGEFLGMLDLSVKATDTHSSFLNGLPYFVLVAGVAITGYLQSHQAQRRTPQINKQMAMITKVIPIAFAFISLQSPSGLVLYWFMSNIWRLGQQEVIFRKYGTGSDPKQPQKRLVQTDVVDVESHDRTKGRSTPKSRPESRAEIAGPEPSEPAESNAPTAPPTGSPTGGLRGFFKIAPPEAEARPARAPAPARKAAPRPTPKPAARGSSATASGRPGQAGRRSQAKKKKR